MQMKTIEPTATNLIGNVDTLRKAIATSTNVQASAIVARKLIIGARPTYGCITL